MHRQWTTAAFTSASVRDRIAELDLDPDTGSGRSYWITIPELCTCSKLVTSCLIYIVQTYALLTKYGWSLRADTNEVVAPANQLLARAVASCGSAVDACAKVAKAQLYMEYLLLLRAAINSTNVARLNSKEDARAGFWTYAVDAVDMVSDAMALTVLANQIKSEMVVNVFYTFAKAVERGDFFGVAAAYDAPKAVVSQGRCCHFCNQGCKLRDGFSMAMLHSVGCRIGRRI